MSLAKQIGKGIKTFSHGGIHPPELKELSAEKPIETFPAPAAVYIPLSQHTGAPCEPTVKPGDSVRMGQVIGNSDAFVSAPIHASVSGKIKKIDLHHHPLVTRVPTIVIENDFLDTWDESVQPDAPLGPLDKAKAKEYLAAVRRAGIVGLGGAAFPTHVKLSPPPDNPIDTLLVNGAECEPYLTSDYRLMLEQPAEILYGVRATMAILGVSRAVIAIENNKPLAIEAIDHAIRQQPDWARAFGEISLAVCQTKYPQGGEKQLIAAVLGRTVQSGKLPMSVGVVVVNAGSSRSIGLAVAQNRPLIERVVTVTGTGVPEPRNLLVRVGALFQELLDYCKYQPQPGSMLIMGGPMMGKAQARIDVPVVKGTSGLVALSEDEVKQFAERPCIRCGRCVEVCPMGLLPSKMAALTEHGKIDLLKDLGILDCMECGSCGYICPSNRQLVQWIRLGKMKLRQQTPKK